MAMIPPVIILVWLSGLLSLGLEDRLHVLAAGFLQYVSKRVESNELRAVILHPLSEGGES